MNTVNESHRRANGEGPERSEIVLIVGTAFQDSLLHLRGFENAILIPVDVPKELEKISIPPGLRDQILPMEVGHNSTIQQLVTEHGVASQRKAVSKLAQLSSIDGFAQLRGLGACGIRDLLSRPETRRCFAKLVPELTANSGGELPQISMKVFAGMAGGVASQGARELMNAVIRLFLDAADVSIDVSVYLLGGISFYSRDFSRTQLNSACSVVEWVSACRRPIDPRVTLTLFAHEAYPVRDRRVERDQLLRDQRTAMTAPIVQSRIQQDRSNKGADGVLGNIFLTQTSHFQPVTERQILTDVSSAYLSGVLSILNTSPTRSRVVDLELQYRLKRGNASSTSDVVAKIIDLPDSFAVLETCQPEDHFESIEPVAWLLEGSSVPLASISETFSELPQTAERAFERLGLLLALIEECIDELNAVDDEVADFEFIVEDAAEDVLSRLQKIQSPPVIPLKSDEAYVASLEDAVVHYRECLRASAEVNAESVALQATISELENLATVSRQRLQTLADKLSECIRYTTDIDAVPHVSAVPFTEVFRQLLASAINDSSDGSVFRRQLAACAGTVTPRGLSTMVGASDDSVDAIVSAVRSNPPAVRSPPWGGESNRKPDVTFYVYPPVTIHYRQMLTDRHRRDSDSVQIAFADLNAPSRNLVVLTLMSCQELSDILTRFYQAGLRKALASPISALFLEDQSVLKDLGIEILNDQFATSHQES